MISASGVVLLLDVDNTRLDNDCFAVDLSARLEQGFVRPIARLMHQGLRVAAKAVSV